MKSAISLIMVGKKVLEIALEEVRKNAKEKTMNHGMQQWWTVVSMDNILVMVMVSSMTRWTQAAQQKEH